MANNQFHDSDHPLFQTTDTFQQLIIDLNHFGDIVDSDMKYLDSALGPETSGYLGKLRGLDDFTANTVTDALNELDSDLHGVGGGNFKADTNTAYKTVTDAINEIERVFDASSGEILYPTGDVTETENRLLISTAQSGGQRIELRAGHNIFLDAVNDVIIDAGGANITFKDDSAIRFDFQMGANQEIDVPTGNLTIDVADDIILDAAGATVDMQVGGVSRVKHDLGASNVVTVNGDYTLDVSGDITLDAGDDDVILKDGTTERFRFNCDAAPNITLTGSSASLTNTAGAFTVNAFTSFVLNTNNGASTWTFNTDTITHTGDAILDVTGDITLSADGNDIIFNNGAGGDTVTHTLTDAGAYTITQSGTGNYTLDIGGDIILDADDATIYMKDGGADRFTFIMGANQEIDVPTGNLTVDVAGDITLDAAGADIDMQVATVSRVKHSLGATNTVTVNGNYTVDVAGNVVIDTSTGSLSLKDDGANAIVYSLDPAGTNTATVTGNLTYDVSGDITLDANGDDFIFKDGTTERFRLNADAAPNMTITGTAASITNTAGDFTINAYQSFVLNTNAGTKSWDIDTDTITHTGDAILDVSGDIALDAGSGVFYYKWDGATQVTRTLSSLTVDSVVGDYTISTDGALVLQVADSASGISFKRGNNTRYQYFFGPENKLEVTGGYHIDVTGNMTFDTRNGNIYFYRDSDQVITWDLDSAITRMDVARTLTIKTQTGGITIDADSDIRLCTHTGHIHFQADSVAHSTEYATFTNNNGDVIFYTGLYSAGQEVYRTDSADINFTRAIGLPTSGAATPHTNAKTVHGALAEVNARIPNVYDRNGILLNA